MEDLTKLGEILPGFLTELLIAFICGGLIGLERGVRNKVAGLRENILICLGAVLFMNIPNLVSDTEPDPVRIAPFVIIGISIIGAGVVIHGRGRTGLASAVKIWVVAAIGLIIGANQWLLAMLVTGITLLILTLLHSLEKNLVDEARGMMLKLTVREDTTELRAQLEKILEKYHVQVRSFRAESGPFGVRLTLQGSNEPEDMGTMISEIWTIQGITEVEH